MGTQHSQTVANCSFSKPIIGSTQGHDYTRHMVERENELIVTDGG